MRLDRNIEPTKNRAATVSSKEMARFREIQNLVRNTENEKNVSTIEYNVMFEKVCKILYMIHI